MDELRELELQEKDYMKKINILETLINIIENHSFKKRPSAYDNMLFLVQEMILIQKVRKEMPDMEQKIYEYSKEEKIVVEVWEEDTNYRQMSLPGLEKIVQKPFKQKKKVTLDMFWEQGSFIKGQSRMRQSDMLLLHDKQTLTDFYKYIMLSEPKRENKKTLATNLSSYVLENPLHLLPALSYSAVETFLSFADLNEQENVMIDEDNIDDYMNLLFWGLLSVEIKCREEKLYFVFAMPEEVQQMVVQAFFEIERNGIEGAKVAGYLEEANVYTLKKLYESYDKIFFQLQKILAVYGAMEIEQMYQMFTELLCVKCGKEDFVRFLYLKGTLQKMMATGQNQVTKQKLVGQNLNIIVQVMEQMQPKVSHSYKYQSYDELEHRFTETINLWKPIYHVLNQWDMSDDEWNMHMCQYIQVVACGKSIADLFEWIYYDFDMEYAVDIASIWRQLVTVCVKYPCYVLKGYNRLQAEQEFGVERYFGMFEVEPSDKIAAKAMIYELPKAFQQQLADMVLLSEQGMFEKLMEQEGQIEEKYRTNPTVSAVMVMNLVDAYAHVSSKKKERQWADEVKQRVQLWCSNIKDSEEIRLMLEWCEEKELSLYFDKKALKKRMQEEETIESYFWGDGETKIMPVIKEEKVYPNEPCPCGSGKKYKKCCGKNR